MSEKLRIHASYRAMKARCYNHNYHSFNDYGGRGITVCSEWLNSEKVSIGKYIHNQSKGYLAFKEWALNNGYKEGLTLDRIDCNRNYEPSNCRWVSMAVQNSNKRCNRYITYKDKKMTLKQWAKELGINYQTLHSRLNKYHWSIDRAFERS